MISLWKGLDEEKRLDITALATSVSLFIAAIIALLKYTLGFFSG